MGKREEVLGLSLLEPPALPPSATTAPFSSYLHSEVLHEILFEKTVLLLCKCEKHCHRSFTLKSKGHFDLQTKKKFSDSLAYRIFYDLFFLKDRVDVSIHLTWSQRPLAEAFFFFFLLI